MKIKSYQYPETIKFVICSDLDETFLPFDDKRKKNSGIAELEQYLLPRIENMSILFGLITGSNLTSVLRKTNGYITRYPHFIASCLGTEFHWIKNNVIKESDTWKKRIVNSGFQLSNVDKIVSWLKNHHIDLVKQAADYQGAYKGTYYYFIRDEKKVDADFQLIKKMAGDYRIKILCNKSNPGAGDPENTYDIEFMPFHCGKGEVVNFLMEELQVSSQYVYCFGDSFNDFSMFSCTENAFLVGNADPEAKKKHPHVLKKSYCFGIREKLEEMLG